MEIKLDLQYPIHDLLIESIQTTEAQPWGSLPVYAFDDHLLKRIGLIEIIELREGDHLLPFMHSEADELWALLEGEANFRWQDRRESSPTLGAVHNLDAPSPVRVLVPFGVEFSISAKTDCKLLRISSQAVDLTQHQQPSETAED
jgi:hypothetical protein